MHQFNEFVIHHWALWALFGVVSLAIIILELSSRTRGITLISPQQVTHLINQKHALVLDVRSEEEFNLGHITGAMHFSPTASEQTNKKLEKYKNKPVIVICQNGSSSTRIAHDLQIRAFNQVLALKGGLDSWVDASLPLVKSQNA